MNKDTLHRFNYTKTMKDMMTIPKNLICLSHLRWDFVYQRPQHLLSRFAKNMNVYVFEEPFFDADDHNYLSISARDTNVTVIVPHLKNGLSETAVDQTLTHLFDQFMEDFRLQDCLFWYYTPMAIKFTDRHKPKVTVYDCMDELSAFAFSHTALPELERKLMAKADVVFTGGHSLYEAKKRFHSNIFAQPSSIDKAHFEQARTMPEAEDQAAIKGPKIGFFGVVDERFDINLLGEMATQKPDWQFIIIGPVVKIDLAQLPKNQNIHYLGQRCYKELPTYLAGWDVALIPFMINESTRFISPTKTPEYLAAHIPVVSTPIRDVVKPYGIKNLVHIKSTADEFIQAIDEELTRSDRAEWIAQVDEFLEEISWQKTYSAMKDQIQNTIEMATKISIAS